MHVAYLLCSHYYLGVRLCASVCLRERGRERWRDEYFLEESAEGDYYQRIIGCNIYNKKKNN